MLEKGGEAWVYGPARVESQTNMKKVISESYRHCQRVNDTFGVSLNDADK